jgi:type IV secretory pathway TrbF-like protein
MQDNVYVEAWRQWDERYADLVLGKRNWQIAAASSMVVSLVLAIGIVWQSSRSRYVPYVDEAQAIPSETEEARRPVCAICVALKPDCMSRNRSIRAVAGSTVSFWSSSWG